MSNALDGMLQGPQGMLQGPIGALVGEATGAEEGMRRAEGRKGPMGLFSFLAPLASAIPGVGPLVSAGLGALGRLQNQGAASGAANAAQLAEAQQLGLAGDAAKKLLNPDYSGILDAERSGFETFKANEGGANPGAAAKDIAGNNLGQAIAGTVANRNNALEGAAGISQGNAGSYNRIGQQAGAAANAGGNPFSGFLTALQGLPGPGSTGSTGGTTPVTASAPAATNFGTQAVDNAVGQAISPNLSPGLPGAQYAPKPMTPISGYQGPNF